MTKSVNNGEIDAAAKIHAGADEKQNINKINSVLNSGISCLIVQ